LVTPLAPTAPVTCNQGMRMTRWFDMAYLPTSSLDASPNFGCSLLDAQWNVKRIHGLIDKLCNAGIPAEKIAIGGFSQGGAMAMLTAMQYPAKLAGCVSLSGLLLGRSELSTLIHPENSSLNVLWCHGADDKLLLPCLQERGCAELEAAGLQVQAEQFRVGHSFHLPTLQVVADFLISRFQ